MESKDLARLEEKMDSNNKMTLRIYTSLVGDKELKVYGLNDRVESNEKRLQTAEAQIQIFKTNQVRYTAVISTLSTMGGAFIAWFGKSLFIKIFTYFR